MRWLFVVLVGALLAWAVLFGARPRRPEIGTAPPSEEQNEVDRGAPALPPLDEGGREPAELGFRHADRIGPLQADAISVLSRHGLSIEEVTILTSGGHAQVRDVVNGTLIETPDLIGSRVWAPGHAPAALPLQSVPRRIVLEADALLSVHGTGLSKLTRASRVHDWLTPADEAFGGLLKVTTFGFVDVDTWRIAVNADSYRASFGDTVNVTFELSGHQQLEIPWKVTSGSRHEVEVPAAGLQQVQDSGQLNVILQRPRAEAGPLEVDLWSILPPPEDRVVHRVEHPWGFMTLYAPRFEERRRVPANVTRFSIMEVPLGHDYGLSLLDSQNGDYGRIFLTCRDGISEAVVDLHPGTRIKGWVTIPPGSPSPDVVSIEWDSLEAPGAPEEETAWGGDEVSWRLEEGQFALLLPRAISRNPGAGYPMPPWARLTIGATGYEPEVRTIRLSGTDADLGELRLTPIREPIVLNVDNGLNCDQVSYGGIVAALDSGPFTFEIGGCAKDEEGRIHLHLSPANESQETSSVFRGYGAGDVGWVERDWPTPAPTYIVVRTGKGDPVGHPFLLLNGTYVHVPSTVYEIELHMSAERDGPVYYGWSWQDISFTVGSIDGAIRGSATTGFPAPETDVDFWWSDQRLPGRTEFRGTLPITAGAEKTEVRLE